MSRVDNMSRLGRSPLLRSKQEHVKWLLQHWLIHVAIPGRHISYMG